MLKKIKTLSFEMWVILSFLFIGFLVTTLYIFNFGVLFHSDVATANLLAREQLHNKSIFPADWFYVQDIWLLFINNIIIFIDLIFNNAVLSRAIAIFIQSILLACVIYFLFKQMNLKKSGIFFLSFVFSGISEMFSNMFFGEGPYSNVVLWILLCILLVFKIIQAEKGNKVYLYILLGVVLILLNLTGLRYAFILIVPMIGSLILYKFFDDNDEITKDISLDFKIMIKLFLLIGISACIGLYIFMQLSNKVSFVKGVLSQVYTDQNGIINNIKIYIFSFLQLFSSLPQLNEKIMSINGLIYVYRAVFDFSLIVLIPFYMIKNYKLIKNSYVKIILWFYIISFSTTSYLYIFGNISSLDLQSARYFIVTFFVALILFACFMQIVILNKEKKIKIAFFLLLIPFFISSFLINLKDIYVYDHSNHSIVKKINEHQHIMDFLEKNGLNYGFASYWNAGVITVLSNYKTEVFPTIIDTQIKPYYWLSSKKWYKRNYYNGGSFILLKGTERNNFDYKRMAYYLGEPIKTLDFEDYKVLIFNFNISGKLPGWPLIKGDKEEYLADVLPSHIGKVVNGARIANENQDLAGFLTFGPYANLEKGKYKLSLTYKAESSTNDIVGKWDIGYELPNSWKKLSEGNLLKGNGKEVIIEEYLEMDGSSKNNQVEFRTYFSGKGTLTVNKIVIEKIE